MNSSRLKAVYFFFALVVVGLGVSLTKTAINYGEITRQCDNNFELPEHAYWERECWWSCKRGWIRDVEASQCKVDPNIQVEDGLLNVVECRWSNVNGDLQVCSEKLTKEVIPDIENEYSRPSKCKITPQGLVDCDDG